MEHDEWTDLGPTEDQDDITGLAQQLHDSTEYGDLDMADCVLIAEKMIGEGMTTVADWTHRPPK